MGKYEKCQINKHGRLNPCPTLGDSFTEQRGKGIRLISLVKEDLQPGVSFAAVFSGEFSKKGLVMNFCPFCGEDIVHHIRKDEDGHGAS